MFRRKKVTKTKESVESTTVALIGCGPAGMMFLHALQSRKAKGLACPNVTCFERASSAGGIWRNVPEDDLGRTKPENNTLMYEDMWCNTPKELMEFPDYTFDFHFKKMTPAFIPRKDMFEYLLARNSVDGALDNVKFNHTVQSVSFDPVSSKFTVSVKDDYNGSSFTDLFDKCIWASGLNGKPNKPNDVLEILQEYTGTVLHSVEATENFGTHAKDKRVMIIGDGPSAEDIALRALKLGAKHVYICARSGEGEASDTTAWPNDKVTVSLGPPYKVLKGTGFKCHAVYWSEKRQKFRKDDEEQPYKIKDIDTVIMATGYEPNLEFLPEDLQFDDEGVWALSKGWIMDNNALTISVGNVEPSKALHVGSTCYPDVYRGLLISNPKMMFIHEFQDSISPILELDVLAHLVLGYLTGDVQIPKEKDMMKANQKQLEAEMQVPWLRMASDMAYREEVDDLPESHWTCNADDERRVKLDMMRIEFLTKRLARDMSDITYPANFGDWKNLSSDGKKFVNIAYGASKTRTTLKIPTSKTFRDNYQDSFVSIFTGKKASMLSDNWLDLKVKDGEQTTLAALS